VKKKCQMKRKMAKKLKMNNSGLEELSEEEIQRLKEEVEGDRQDG